MATTFPLATDYVLAARDPDKFILDTTIKQGRARLRNGSSVPWTYIGGFALVFCFEVKGKRYAFRCWVRDSGDSLRIYREVQKHIEQIRSPYFVPFVFSQEGIVAGNKRLPTVRMDWVEGLSLKEYIQSNIGKPMLMAKLRERFVSLCAHLHQHNISHGDLQPENITVNERGGEPHLVLVDYDSMVVPSLVGMESRIAGVPGFQHPARGQTQKASLFMDYFSELVIYVCILAFERSPSLWKKFDVENREKELLFTESDFAQPRTSSCLRAVSEIDGELRTLIGYLASFCEAATLDKLFPIEWVLDNVKKNLQPPLQPSVPKSALQTSKTTALDDELKALFPDAPAPQEKPGPDKPKAVPDPNGGSGVSSYEEELDRLKNGGKQTTSRSSKPGKKRLSIGYWLFLWLALWLRILGIETNDTAGDVLLAALGAAGIVAVIYFVVKIVQDLRKP
jgi:serine/threonine protein kinase